MKIGNYTFNERTRQQHPCGQIIARGMMDMGDYDEAALVSIVGRRFVAYVEDQVIEGEL